MFRRFLSLFKRERKYKFLQEYFFATALEEVQLPNETIKIDHYHGRCWSPETDWIPLVFPEKILTFVESLPKEKSRDYFFRGFISANRDWLRQYSGCEYSDYGRKSKTKFHIDEDYYSSMSSARFGLAPVGDCPWSYRFFEAVMCHSIPILGKKDQDIFSEEYHFDRDGSEHEFNPESCLKNYQTFLKNHTLRNFRQ